MFVLRSYRGEGRDREECCDHTCVASNDISEFRSKPGT